MFETSFRNTDEFIDRSMRVLLCIANPRDRELLADQLRSAELEVRTADGTDTLAQFDICVTDTTTYPSIRDTVDTRRDELAPLSLPVLMVLGPNESEQSLGPYWENIDDVLSVPTSATIFQNRVDTLLSRRRQSEQLALFAQAMDDAETGISISDAGGDQELRYVNDSFLEITGYDREETLGRNCRFLQGPETDPECVEQIRSAIDEQRSVSVTLRNYRKNGQLFWNNLDISPVYNRDTVTHFVGVQQDVTDRVEQTQALQRFEEIVSAAGDPIYALNDDLHFTLVSEATTAFSGRAESELLGAHVQTVFGTAHAERLGEAVLELAESASAQTTISTRVEDTAGRMRQFQTTVSLLPATSFEGVVCVSRDITEEQERESRLSVLDRVLRHNLRNKLMVMLAQVEQIQTGSDDESVTDSAETIKRVGTELLELAETARDFQQTLEPAGNDDISPVNVGSRTLQAVEEARLEYGDSTSINAEVSKHRWAMAHDSFELAMTELLEQAATAGDDVTVTVEITADSEAETVSIVISHDGTGLDAVERAALNSGVESDLEHTQGLGMWFVRWMTINSGGTFTIENADPGTRVKLTLPLFDTPPGVSTRGQ